MIRLLGRKTSGNVQKVMWLLEELGLEHSREDYGRQFKNTSDQDYLEMNPTGKVPTVIDGGIVLRESNTILRYLAGKVESELLPSDLLKRAQSEIWMDWLLASLNAPYLDLFKESKKDEEDRSPQLPQMASALAGHLEILDSYLQNNEWVGGDQFTVADIALGPICHRCLNFPVDLPSFGQIDRWHRVISQRPAFQKTVLG